MIFNEIYGYYFRTLEAILSEAVEGTLSEKRINEIVRVKAFRESGLVIPEYLKSGKWHLLCKDYSTPLKHKPGLPETLLEKRWLKTMLQDPRITLFGVTADGLEDVEPLYQMDTFVYFDRYSDGDPYEAESYRENFSKVLTGLDEKKKLGIKFKSQSKTECAGVFVPLSLEYSSKDDKFRLICLSDGKKFTVNLGRIISCEILEAFKPDDAIYINTEKKTAILKLTDERNALERAMLHFSYFEKETVKTDADTYQINLKYDGEDETELIIRILSFGPMIKAISPDSLVAEIKNRIGNQRRLGK